MKTRASLSCLAVAFATTVLSPAPTAAEAPSVDAILAHHVTALGGQAAIEKIKSRVVIGTVTLPGMADSGWELQQKAPNQQLSIVDIPTVGKMRDGFDGKVAWSDSPFGGLREKTGDELAKTTRDNEFYRDLHFKTLYPGLAVVGTEKDGDQEVAVLESKPGAGVERFYFNLKTGLLARQVSEFDSPAGRVKVNSRLSDYRAVEGVQFPHQLNLNVASPGQPEMEVTIKVKDVRVNVPLDDARFAKPTKPGA